MTILRSLKPVQITPSAQSQFYSQFPPKDTMPDGAEIMINGDKGLLSKNTIPGEKPWRATWFDFETDGTGIGGHVDMSVQDAIALFAGDEVCLDRQSTEYHIMVSGAVYQLRDQGSDDADHLVMAN